MQRNGKHPGPAPVKTVIACGNSAIMVDVTGQSFILGKIGGIPCWVELGYAEKAPMVEPVSILS